MQLFKSTSLRIKLFTISFISILIIFIEGFNSYWGIHSLMDEFNLITKVSVPKNLAISQLDLSFRSLRIELRTLGLEGLSKDQKEKIYLKITNNIESFEKAEKDFVSHGFIGEDKQSYEKLMIEWIGFKKLGGKILELSKSEKLEDKHELINIFLNDCPAFAERVEVHLSDLTKFYSNKTNSYITHANMQICKLIPLIS